MYSLALVMRQLPRGPSQGRFLEKQPLSLEERGLGDKTNQPTCESNAKGQRSSVRDLEEN